MLSKSKDLLSVAESGVRIPTWHRHWSSFTRFNPEKNEVIQEVYGSKGKYLIEQEELHVSWENWPPEIFVWREGILVLKDLATKHLDYENNFSTSSRAIIFVREPYDRNEALHRVQSEPLIRGLQVLGISVHVLNPDLAYNEENITNSSHLVFHYKNRRACEVSYQIKKSTGCKAICLASDIYSLQWYVDLSNWVDVFFAPTKLHQNILAASTGRPVFHLPEFVDSIALPSEAGIFPVEQNQNICWFGYPESFDKSLGFILRDLVLRGDLDPRNFGILASGDDNLMPGADHIKFSSSDFYKDTARFRYSLLSHFPFDMHVNSLIKSPNKLITSIVRGMIPVFSATPSYLDVAATYDLEGLHYCNANELVLRLRDLDKLADLKGKTLDKIRSRLLFDLSPPKIAAKFLSDLY
ncbi:hypothetical protein ACLBX9_30165 [Methylobacterium sp. A49B]